LGFYYLLVLVEFVGLSQLHFEGLNDADAVEKPLLKKTFK